MAYPPYFCAEVKFLSKGNCIRLAGTVVEFKTTARFCDFSGNFVVKRMLNAKWMTALECPSAGHIPSTTYAISL